MFKSDDPGEPELIKFFKQIGWSMALKEYHKTELSFNQKYQASCGRQISESTEQNGTIGLDQEHFPIDDSSLSSISQICPAPICRQFWKAGNYNEGLISKSSLKNGANFLHIHPKFLHSNATSHKWAFGAIAELLDNAVDEIQNGATFAIVDKTINPRDGSSGLIIQDNGGGMDPEAMRRCLSFGFSDKKSNLAIGHYGNGFKTSSMRLGADVVVFSRCMKNRKVTQSIGLLSYTFLTQAGLDRIVVPMIEYEVITSTGKWNSLRSEQHFMSNLSLLLRWSPYGTEAELLKQFDDIGDHGTKIIIYNLWLNDEGKMELDFQSDPEDICISGLAESGGKSSSRMLVSDLHLANSLRYSLRAYLSVLYLRIPENFSILLRGRIVEYHNIANDLKYPEFIMYKPQSGGCQEVSVITSIGFLKEAPLVNVHGFNVYHKNRLILPFWSVVSSGPRNRGVVGVLEANFIQPTHNKQDFEKTPLFQKLENRLKEMTFEYWDFHCGLIGYHVNKSPRAQKKSQASLESGRQHGTYQPTLLSENTPCAAGPSVSRLESSMPSLQNNSQEAMKRKNDDLQIEPENVKRRAECTSYILRPPTTSHSEDQHTVLLLQENKKLRARCLEYEKMDEELSDKVTLLRKELKEAQREYRRLLVQSSLLENVKRENIITL